jgi:hypothetical protein
MIFLAIEYHGFFFGIISRNAFRNTTVLNTQQNRGRYGGGTPVEGVAEAEYVETQYFASLHIRLERGEGFPLLIYIENCFSERGCDLTVRLLRYSVQ